MKTIPLTQGKVAIVDDDAPAWIFEVKWYARRDRHCWYARRNVPREGGGREQQYLHHVIIDARLGEVVDHVNGDGLDDRKQNLRITTHTDNIRGFSHPYSTNSSGFRGVSWDKRALKWKAYIRQDAQTITIGRYDILIDAVLDRDKKARELGWPDSGMNFPLYGCPGN